MFENVFQYKFRLIEPRIRIKIATTNRKGGVGKSSINQNLAAELACRGYRVGVVDLDSQGQASVWFGMPKEDNLFKAMIGMPEGDYYARAPLRELVRPVPLESYMIGDQSPFGALFLLSSSVNTYKIPFLTDDPDLFGDLLEEYIDDFDLDIIMIDTAPTMSMLDGAVYMATDGFIHVTEVETLSLDGLNESIGQIERFAKRRLKQGRLANQLLGIVPNKYQMNLNLHRRNLNNLGEAFYDQPGMVWTPVRRRKAWMEAVEYGMTVRAYAPESDEAQEVVYLADQTERVVAAWLGILG